MEMRIHSGEADFALGVPMSAERQIETILTFLSAHPRDQVMSALKRYNTHLRGERIAAGWRIFAGTGEPPSEAGDRMKIGEHWYTRERPAAPARPMPAAIGSPTVNGAAEGQAQAETRNPQPKSDLSMKATDRKCPTCGDVMAWEPICPGCALGRLGFAGRYVCMDDMTHEFYVTKPGVELSNQ